MADISQEIAAFRNAVYGEDVRSAMISLANKVNNESSAAAAVTADGSITTAKLADGSITTAKLADGSVTLSKLGNDIEITPPDGSITDAKLVQSGGVLEKVDNLESAFNDAIYVEDPTNKIGVYETGYWSNGVHTETTYSQTRKITIPEGAKRIRVSDVSKFYDYYDFLTEDETVISYKRKMTDVTTDEVSDIPSNAAYVVLSDSNAVNIQNRKLFFSYFVNAVLNDTAEQTAINTTTLNELSSIEIEGYNKTQWSDVTDTAVNVSSKYAEMHQGKVVINSGSNYKYAVLDVTPGEGYKTSGVYVFDMRPVIYTDANDNVLLYEPIQRVTTPQYLTAETTVPEGATKLYVCGRKDDTIIIKKKGIYYQAEESTAAPNITVRINRNEYPDTSIITDEFKQTVEVFNSAEQPNHAVLPRAVYANVGGAWKTIVNNEDDNCPVSLSSGYLGAGHGYDRARKVTAANHGKTYADIGSEWLSGTDHAWLVRVVDADTLIFMGKNATSNGYDTDSFTGTTLTHVNGAVHTDTITGSANVQYLITPVDKNHVKKVMLDGTTEVSADGEYEAFSFVDVIDEYDIINPRTIVSEILANKPSGGYTENPPINTGSTFLHFSNVYRYLLDGTMLIFTTLDNNMNVTLGYWGATQYAQKSAENAFGGALFRYIPKVLPMDSHEMRIPFNMANWNFTVNATTQYWEDANNPPDRMLHLYTNGNGKYAAGFAVGYLPIAEGAAAVRKTNINNAMYLYNTKKAYFHLVDSGGTDEGAWAAYKPFQSIVYRKPIMDVANIHTDAYFVPLGEKCYLYADYHAIANDRIKVPAEYVGKPITVVEKSSNVTVYGTIATDEIRVRCTTASPMYGYAVVQIG